MHGALALSSLQREIRMAGYGLAGAGFFGEVECDIRLADPNVSRRHAELSLERGQWIVRDLGSGRVVYESRAINEGPGFDNTAVLPADHVANAQQSRRGSISGTAVTPCHSGIWSAPGAGTQPAANSRLKVNLSNGTRRRLDSGKAGAAVLPES